MTEFTDSPPPESYSSAPPGVRPQRHRWSRLCIKELRETLRDRRTLITLILMPLLVYPVLSMVFQRSLMSVWNRQQPGVIIGVGSDNEAAVLKTSLTVGDGYLRRSAPSGRTTPNKSAVPEDVADILTSQEVKLDEIRYAIHEDLDGMLENEKVDLAVSSVGGGRLVLTYREGSALSVRALRFVEERLRAVNERAFRDRLRKARQNDQPVFRPSRRSITVESTDSTLGTVVPMILILMTLTGAVYPAIDLTAGERERGTLEMLMASPVPRLKLLLAKYVAVVSVAFLTALVNLLAMAITLQATGLSNVVFGETGLSLIRVAQILLLLVVFAAFFSAVLLALTSFARSFKEAQAYLIPLMLLSLGPGIVSLLPGLQLRGLMAITPISNLVLLARDLCGPGVNPFMATVAILSTALYTLAAIAVAARIFGADAVLSGGQMGLADVFTGGTERREVSSVPGALLCLAVLFPIYFVVANVLGQLKGVPISARLVISGVATSVLFGMIPLGAALIQRLRIGQAFQWHRTPITAFIVAPLLGLTLWPIAHEIFLLNVALGLVSLRPDQLKSVENLLLEWKSVQPVWILLSMALAPAVFEELFFRGYLFSAFRNATKEGSARSSFLTTVGTTSLLFGLFHVISTNTLSIERFLPSTFLGIVLGCLCYQAKSVIPGIILHACHNGLLLMIAYYREELLARGWGVAEESHLPASWIAISVGMLAVGSVVLFFLPRWRTAGVP